MDLDGSMNKLANNSFTLLRMYFNPDTIFNVSSKI